MDVERVTDVASSSTRDAMTILRLQLELQRAERRARDLEASTRAGDAAIARARERAEALERDVTRLRALSERGGGASVVDGRRAREALEALERRVAEAERAAAGGWEQARGWEVECESMRKLLAESARECGALQVEAGKSRGAEEEARRARRAAEAARRERDAVANAMGKELDEATRRMMSLEASTNEAKRALCDAMEEEVGEKETLSVVARRAADALRGARSRVKALERARNDGAKGVRPDGSRAFVGSSRGATPMEEERALDEAEAALADALETARRWKSAAERERAFREAAEDELERINGELHDALTSLSRARAEKHDSDRRAADVRGVVERVAERVRSLEDATGSTLRLDSSDDDDVQ